MHPPPDACSAEDVIRLALGDTVVDVVVGAADPLYGPRFDRTARVVRIRRGGADFLEVRGLADEFGLGGMGVLGYTEAGEGGSFLKIGVGRLKKLDAAEYHFARHYPILAMAPIRAQRSGNTVSCVQQSERVEGYQYAYRKEVQLADEGVLQLKYHLANIGERPFEFEHYNHNFLRFGGHDVGPQYEVATRFALESWPPEPWSRAGRTLRLRAPAPAKGTRSVGLELVITPDVNGVTVRHADGQTMRIGGDFTAQRFALWAVSAALSPEVFFRARIEPGAATQWSRTYAFERGPAS